MEKVVDLAGFRADKEGHPRDAVQIELEPPEMVVRHYRDGVLVREERTLSECFLRDLLDRGQS